MNPAAGDRGHHQLSFFIDIFGAESKNLTLTRNGYWLGINENPRLTVITPPSLSDFFLSRWKLTFSQVLHTCAEGQYEVTTCNSYGCDRKSFSIAEGGRESCDTILWTKCNNEFLDAGCKQDDCQSRPSERLLSCVKILELGNIPSRVNDTNSTSPMQSIVEKPVVSAEVSRTFSFQS